MDVIAYGRTWCPGHDRPSPRPLGGLPRVPPSKREARASIALALEQLQTGDLPFDGAIAPGQGETRFDGREVLLQALGEAGPCVPTKESADRLERCHEPLDFAGMGGHEVGDNPTVKIKSYTAATGSRVTR
jgi:hypothetical protein